MANRVQERLKFVEGVYGDNWRKLRESEGKSVREFQKTIPMSFSSISKIENEITPPTIAQINLYQEHFHCSLDYLTGYSTSLTTNLADVCTYTGLSEKAVIKLHNKANNPRTNDTFMLSDIIESKEFDSILDLFIKAVTSREFMLPNDEIKEYMQGKRDEYPAIFIELAVQNGLSPYYKQQISELTFKLFDRMIDESR